MTHLFQKAKPALWQSNLKGHEPVLLEKILDLSPFLPPGQNKHMLDATFGCGGHTKAFLKHFPKLSIIAIDRDIQAIQWGKKHVLSFLSSSNRLKLFHTCFYPFSDLISKGLFLKGPVFDVILLDLGVSSLQLDQANRGFSFYKDGPLDMRMDQSQNLKASDIINHFSEQELKEVLCQGIGVELSKNSKTFYKTSPQHETQVLLQNSFFSWTSRNKKDRININKVIKAILKERKKKPIESTKELADLIVKQIGWRKKGKHPATAYFLALRLKVNEEILSLIQSLPKMIKSLKPGGRLFVLSFHSTEDKMVKLILKKAKENKEGQVFKKSFFPSQEEIKKNPRARSAKLRVFEKA